MQTMKKWIANSGLLILAGAAIVMWFTLPVYGVLVLASLASASMLATRSGRLALAVAWVGVSELPRRWRASLVLVVGIAGVVGVLVAVLAMGEGFASTLRGTGSDDAAIVLRAGSQSETTSLITREEARLIAEADGTARDQHGNPLASAEMSQVVSLVTQADHTDASALLRGIGEAGWALRPQVKIVEGRPFHPGRRELVVGTGAARQYAGLAVGSEIELANQVWNVVGRFSSGDTHDSELWTDVETLGATYGTPTFQLMVVRLQAPDGLARLRAALAADARLDLEAETTRSYYTKQSERLTALTRTLGILVGAIMALGAVFGALNTMYAAVATRTREIATMRAIGFHGPHVVLAVMLESLLLALIGGALGAAIAAAVFNGYSVATLGNNFSQVMFEFRVTPELVWTGLRWALAIGFVGGLFPALRASTAPVAVALRAR
jgi:putative ABC transport system permease protein